MPAKKQVTKEMILNSAFKVLKEQGYEAINIKILAKELNCSTQPIYLSFDGMDGLRNELISSAIDEFKNIMRKNSEDGVIRLYGMSYVSFAKKEPHLFSFLFMRTNSFSEIKRILLPIIDPSVDELAKNYCIKREEADVLHDQLQMHSHGIASMVATEFCDWNTEKADTMLVSCLRAFTEEYGA